MLLFVARVRLMPAINKKLLRISVRACSQNGSVKKSKCAKLKYVRS